MVALEVSNLTKSFGKINALKGISFSVEEGTIFGFLGPNGAGKTTTIRIILGLLKPDQGYVKIFGQPVNENTKKDIGVVLETPGVYEGLTAKENLEYFGQLYEFPVSKLQSHINELLEMVSLKERGNDLVRGFSKGMKQKLALARALLNRPKILILDDPTAGLDPSSQSEIREILLDLSKKEGTTVFLSSHNLDEVERVCSYVGLLHKGELLALDKTKDLKDKFSNPNLNIITTGFVHLGFLEQELSKLDFVKSYRIEQNKIQLLLTEETDAVKVIAFLAKKEIGILEAKLEKSSLIEIFQLLTKER